jgi:hypothetical protein
MTNNKFEEYKEKLFNDLWNEYWWNKRGFGYRCSHSEQEQAEIIATAFEVYIEKFLKGKLLKELGDK